MSNVNKKETPNMKKRPKIDFKIIGRILSYIEENTEYISVLLWRVL